MKKLLAILLAVLCMVSVVACGSKDEAKTDDKKEEVTTPVKTDDVEPAETTEADVTTEDTTPAEPDPFVAREHYEFGVIDGNTYENKYFGVGCKLPSDLVALTEEEIMANNIENILGDDEATLTQEDLDNAFAITEYYAENENATVSVQIEAYKKDAFVGAGFKSIEDYDSAEEFVETLVKVSQDNNNAADIKEYKSGTVKFLGEEVACGFEVYSLFGYTSNEIVIPLMKGPEVLMVEIAYTVSDEHEDELEDNPDLDEILGYFYSVN